MRGACLHCSLYFAISLLVATMTIIIVLNYKAVEDEIDACEVPLAFAARSNQMEWIRAADYADEWTCVLRQLLLTTAAAAATIAAAIAAAAAAAAAIAAIASAITGRTAV